MHNLDREEQGSYCSLEVALLGRLLQTTYGKALDVKKKIGQGIRSLDQDAKFEGL